jgi:hypothetical protein
MKESNLQPRWIIVPNTILAIFAGIKFTYPNF